MLAQSAANSETVIPGMVKFAGALTDLNHKPLTGTVGVTFSLYKEQAGGVPLWTETQNVEADKNGHYSVLLGSTGGHGIPVDAFIAGEARWLAVEPSGQPEQTRVMLASVPYAMKAHDAETINGLPASAFVLAAPAASGPENGAPTNNSPAPAAAGTITGSGSAGFLPDFTAPTQVGNSAVFQSGSSPTAKIGINTITPGAALDVVGSTNFRGSVTLLSTGTATQSAGSKSQPMDLKASAFNTSTKSAVAQTFQLQAEPVNNNTANPSGALSLLYGSGTKAAAETGLKINNKGLITFAPGQTFPGTGTGNGTVTNVGLSAPASDFNVTSSSVTSNGTLAFEWQVAPTSLNTPNAIVKRDSSGSINAQGIGALRVSATSLFATNNLLGHDTAPVTGINGDAGAADNGFGVFGDSFSGLGAGVLAAAEGGGIGVFGQAGFHNLGGQGVFGESFGTQFSANGFGPDGVDGVSHNSAGSGVAAINTAGGTGVFAQTNGGLAGDFHGDVSVNGNLAKAGGSFKIDHPLDPENKYLYHSFVESPDMMNIYNGNVTTDAQGNAVVELPEWFETLNRDFRYQLTVMGQFAQAIVGNKMANHSFVIQTDKPNVEVSWQVTGIRHDAWADAHRIPVEQEKPENERGHYLHPELFGAPAEKSIASVHHPGLAKMMKEGTSRHYEADPVNP